MTKNSNGTLELIADLEKAIGAEQVKFDHMTRLLYSTDASNYQIMPIGVTIPRDVDDIVAIHEVANKHQTPLLPRGGGSSLAGQTVGQAVVMDFSRHLRRIRSINAETASVMVEPGVVLGQLNQQLKGLNLMYGPDPASAERATIGGCIGNNSTGSHSILYGMTADNIARLEVVLANGERVWLDANTERLNALRQKIGLLVQTHADEIKARYPKTFRTVAGYALNKIDPGDVNLNWLFAGSEGTLGTIIGAELKLVPTPKMKRLVTLHFDTLHESLEITPRLLEVNPSAVELMDRFLINKTRSNPDFARYLSFVEGDPAAIQVVEFYGEDEKELESKVETLLNLLKKIGYRGITGQAITPEQQSNIWKVRTAGLGLLMSERGDAKPIAFIEDAAVPVAHLAEYIDDVEKIVHEAGTTFAIYAHASAGCLHVRPLVNLKSEAGRRQYRSIAEAVAEKVIQYQGTTTGEHGEGLLRGEFSEQLFGKNLVDAFREIKQIFDPDNLMNPGKVVDTGKMDDPKRLRFTPDYEVIPLKTRYDWSSDFGFSGAAEMCNGAGVCRKEGIGTMCPSFMATLDEAHATRGRANALRLAISGHIPEKLGSKDVYGIYDLCLACKACKAECPSSVDVARMKSEFLAAHYDERGIPFTARIFGNVHRLNQTGSIFPALSNFMLRSPIGKFGAKLFGIPSERPLPLFAKKRFSRITRARHASPLQDTEATLIIDTFTEFNHPEIGEAMLKIADVLGLKLSVMRLPGQCCGRPAISKGLLDQAKAMTNSNIQNMPNGESPFIFLEPSCLSAFIDDYPVLVDVDLQERAAQIAKRCMSAETWLIHQMQNAESLQWNEKDQKREILLHGHCHQKALWGTGETLQLLKSIPDVSVKEIDSGCCGVAGSFGYEHYELSLKIGNQRLLPAIRENPGAIVAAPGTSCRAQIHDNGLKAQHPIEIFADAIASVSRN
ncbi:MAG TPA: FAD-linked oxidase C-terminal domain-containing protein [Aggregatilineales bacterium]|nr:FAD-linked oxidase C-terminal domain-containing protein [Aggregatilineales bacterium]